MTNLLTARRAPQITLQYPHHYTPSHTPSYILTHNHSTNG